MLVFINISHAQNAILPFTGAKIFTLGLAAKSIEITIDGYILTSNIAPLNKEIVFKLIQPQGFVTDASKKYYPVAEVTITDAAGVVLGRTADAFYATATTGVAPEKFKELIVKTGLSGAVIKNNTALTISINLSDKKSKNSLKIIFPVQIATASQGLKASAGVLTTPVNAGGIIYTSNVKIKKADYKIDNEIRVDPTLSYCSVELTEITGAAIDEIAAGKEIYYVFDANLQQVLKKDKLLKSIKGSIDGNVSTYLLKIPFKLKTDKANYFVRFRWESKDGKRIIDGVFKMQ